jgi:hypothetical protein
MWEMSWHSRLPMLGRMVRDVAAELTLALGGVLPPAKSP